MFIPSHLSAWVCTAPTDMRRSFNGLSALAREVIRQEPTSGHLFVFFSRRRDCVKILYWDISGFCIWSKRLEEGTYAKTSSSDNAESIQLDRAQLLLILEGIDLKETRKRKRFAL